MAMDTAVRPPAEAGLAPRLLAGVLAAAVAVAGIWVTGGLITNDFRVSMALTALWFGVVAVGSALLWRRSRGYGAPVAIGAVGTLVIVGGYLALASFRDVTVNERVAVGPALASGSFVGVADDTSGTARIVRDGGGLVQTLTRFETDPGPDLFVYLADGPEGDLGRSVRLDDLKGNRGNQQYRLPAGASAGELRQGGHLVPRVLGVLRRGAAELGP
jgi:hypothetical protein